MDEYPNDKFEEDLKLVLLLVGVFMTLLLIDWR